MDCEPHVLLNILDKTDAPLFLLFNSNYFFYPYVPIINYDDLVFYTLHYPQFYFLLFFQFLQTHFVS